MKNNFASNLKYLRLQSHMTQEQLAHILEKDYSTIGKWELGQRSPMVADVVKISELFNISLEKLICSNIVYDDNQPTNINHNIIKIPVYKTIKAESSIENQTDIIEYIDIPKDWTNCGKNFYGLKIMDDSMNPKYSKNDIVIFEQNNNLDLCNGKDCVIIINNKEFDFKKLIINEQNIVLQPYNASHDIKMYPKKQIEIIGIAKEKRTKLD